MNIIIKTFKTPGGNYVYDRYTNKLLNVNEYEFSAFQNIENGKFSESDKGILEKFQSNGFCKDNEVIEINHPATPFVEYHLKTRISQLTLQLTQNCNLRCKYCTYSGDYENQRVHTSKNMSYDVILKSIDFLFENSKEVSEVVIGFYGGEPLLMIENIKNCIDYIKSKYDGRAVRYTLTTNGTLFNKNIIDTLVENNFDVNISFDGPKELHDINRVYENGMGSFDDIMNNLKNIKKDYPSLFNKIMLMSIIAPGIDYMCVDNFFNASDVMEHKSIVVGTVNQYNSKNDIVYDDSYIITNNYQYMKVLLSCLNMYDKNKISLLFKSEIIKVKRFFLSMNKGSRLNSIDHPGGPCVPGVMRPFVSTDGSIYPCERVNEDSEIMKIGHVETGYDINKVKMLLNVGHLTKEECKKCWAFINCTLCCAASDDGTELSRKLRLKNCIGAKNNMLNNLKTICLLKENRCAITDL